MLLMLHQMPLSCNLKKEPTTGFGTRTAMLSKQNRFGTGAGMYGVDEMGIICVPSEVCFVLLV